MIGRLIGKVSEDDDGTLVVDVQGVGYEVACPLGTLGRADRDDDGRVTFYVHTHVREDALSLFGFASEADRLAFRTLIGVSNVGPKSAITVLSALPAPDLAAAIARKDLGQLTAIPGIGKKTAERLLLELKDKLPVAPVQTRPSTAGTLPRDLPPEARHDNAGMLARALVNMGYRVTEADRAVEKLGDRVHEATLPELLREALAVLAK
jgi:holliday junction DNA helicase RuvA